MAQVTLVPFAQLPACVKDCGVLYDVNGGCVPPAKPQGPESQYQACICGDARLAVLNQGVSGVCDGPCAANPPALTSVRDWFTNYCANAAQPGAPTTETQGGQTTGGAGGSSGSTRPGGAAGSGGGHGDTWLSTHYQWVIFLVIIVLAIVGIWVGACIWRRRYLRKKDRQYALGKALGNPHMNRDSAPSVHLPQAGMFQPANLSSANVYDMGPAPNEKKKWGGLRRNH